MRPFYWKNYPKFVFDDVHSDNLYDRFSYRKWCHIRWLPAWVQKAHAWTTITLILSWWMMGQLTNTEERFHSEPVLRIVSREKRWKNRAVGTAIHLTTYILIIDYFQLVRSHLDNAIDSPSIRIRKSLKFQSDFVVEQIKNFRGAFKHFRHLHLTFALNRSPNI